MPRVRWYSYPLPVLCLLGSFFWIATTLADCWYDDEIYEEGTEVTTKEPCLNCTCSRGALLCYLRVCPTLPHPPPPGCIILHRYRTCCSELICTEIFGGVNNALEARSEPDGIDLLPPIKGPMDNACVYNGSIYGPGSAMDSSTFCEYCYCLGGKQTCVKPNCLPELEGCTPVFEPTNCCPIHYNCTNDITITSTTTIRPKKGGCVVDGAYYNEGGKVLGVGHSICDNCYCLRGIVRCEPLSCAPPLLGCSPVIRPGECCAASYNCSGTIETQPEPNYGEYPIVSKEYAKLRKEVTVPMQFKHKKATENSNIPFYVIAESSQTTTKIQRSPGTFGTTRHFTGSVIIPSTPKPFHSLMEENLTTSENKDSTRSYVPNKIHSTTNYESQNYKKSYSTTNKPIVELGNLITTTDYQNLDKNESDYFDLTDETLLSIVDSLLDSRLDRRVETNNDTEDVTINSSTIETSTTVTTDATTYETSTLDLSTTSNEDIVATTNIPLYPITVKTILNSTDCIESNDTIQNRPDLDVTEITTTLPVDVNEINKLAEVKIGNEDLPTSSEETNTETTTNEDITEIDLESKMHVTNATIRSIPKEIEAILNFTKEKEQDYEYDYNEPSLPPSLPNLRIIPFVAADALDSEKEKHNIIYSSQDRVTEILPFSFKNLFSPPMETEGGFIPKEPPSLENFYENALTATSITNTTKIHQVSCIKEGREIQHGEAVTSKSPCVTCSCFYGNIVCQKIPCSLPRAGCRMSSVQDLGLCCPHYVCDDEEAPTVVLDRLEGTPKSPEVVTVAEGVNTPDPFRDVIRTEPAPDLQSLIVDMMPFLARQTTPIPPSTTTTAPIPTSTNITSSKSPDDDFFLDKVLQLLFSHQTEENVQNSTAKPIQTLKENITTSTTVTSPIGNNTQSVTVSTTPDTRENSNLNEQNHPNSVDSSSPGTAILKLAGCNIYGRMYRVGRIISELSNPCLECKCTEIGVQCRALKC